MRPILAVIGGFLLLPGCADLSLFDYFHAGAQYFDSHLDGDLDLGDFQIVNEGDGTTLFSADNVTIKADGEKDEAPVYTGSIALPGVLLDGRYLELEYEGTNLLTADVTLNLPGIDPVTFAAGVPSQTEIDVQFGTLLAKIGLFEVTSDTPGVPGFAAGLSLGVNYLDVDARAIVPVANIAVEDDFEGVFPAVGAAAVVELPLAEHWRLFGTADVSGLAGDFDELRGHFLDVKARIGTRIAPLVLGIGYQFFDIDVEDRDNFDADLELDGLFIFGEIGF